MVKYVTGMEIKKILKKYFPNAVFIVRVKSYSSGRSIRIYTNLVKEIPPDLYRKAFVLRDVKAMKKLEKLQNQNDKIIHKIKYNILKDFWEVDYDPVTREILSGANVYLSVEPMKRYNR